MSIASNDKWLWLGLGCFTFFTIYTVYNSRSELLRLAEVQVDEEPKKDEQKHWEVNQDTEDRVSAEALFELAKSSTNTEIRKSAAKILFERMLHDESARASINADARSPRDSAAYRSFKNLEALADSFHDPYPRQLLDSVVHIGSPPNSTHFRTADELNEALRTLTDSLNSRSGTRPRNGGSTTPLPGIRRAAPIGELEQELRRRRREAIVLNEGDRPVTQEDIIQRRRTGVSVGVASNNWNDEPIDAEIVDAIEQGLAMIARGEDPDIRGW